MEGLEKSPGNFFPFTSYPFHRQKLGDFKENLEGLSLSISYWFLNRRELEELKTHRGTHSRAFSFECGGLYSIDGR